MRMRTGRRAVAGIGVLVMALGAGGSPADAGSRLAVKKKGTISPGATEVLVPVTASCDPGMELLEARISVSQEDQGVNGDGPIGSFPCDGRRHAVIGRARTFDSQYHPGEAFASAFLLVIDPETQQTQSVGDTRVIRLEPTRS